MCGPPGSWRTFKFEANDDRGIGRQAATPESLGIRQAGLQSFVCIVCINIRRLETVHSGDTSTYSYLSCAPQRGVSESASAPAGPCFSGLDTNLSRCRSPGPGPHAREKPLERWKMVK